MKTIERRSSRPMFLGPAMNRLLMRLGAVASDTDLAARWTQITADLPTCELGRISRKNRSATVRAKNPAERLALSYDAEEIAKRINAYFGYDAVDKISIK